MTTTENGSTEKVITTKQEITTTENGSTEKIIITLQVFLLLSIIGSIAFFWKTGRIRWVKRGLEGNIIM